jgi:hypothetical protein
VIDELPRISGTNECRLPAKFAAFAAVGLQLTFEVVLR